MNIEDIQTICLKMKGVKEDIKWGHDLVFSIGEKMFCVVGLEQSPTSASFKVSDEEFEEMCNRPGFKPAPYVARYKWVWTENIRSHLKNTSKSVCHAGFIPASRFAAQNSRSRNAVRDDKVFLR